MCSLSGEGCGLMYVKEAEKYAEYMDSTEEQGDMNFLHTRWENAGFENQDAENNKQRKEEMLRNFMSLINQSHMTQSLSGEGCGLMYVKGAEKYAEYMDSTEEQGGLNNYAAGALSLLSNRPTECDMWKCSLSLDSPQLPCVSTYSRLTQAAKVAVVPPGREDEVLLTSAGQNPDNRNKVQPATPSYSPQTNASCPPERARFGQPTGQQMPPSSSHHIPSGQYLSSGPSLPPSEGRYASASCEGGRPGHRQPAPVRVTGVSAGFLDIYREQGGGQPPQTDTGDTSTQHPQIGCFGNFKQTESGNNFAWKRTESAGKRGREECVEEGTEQQPGTQATWAFKTARQQLAINNQKQGKNKGQAAQGNMNCYGTNKKSLGTRRGVSSRFVPPVMSAEGEEGQGSVRRPVSQHTDQSGEPVDERLKNIDSKMVDLIMSEIMDQSHTVTWNDIAGLQFAKKTIQEIVVWPMLRPDIFTGLRGPPKGLLLFGPPGTGKTLIGKCIASQSKSTFFSISASSLTSKWVGEGEKMVRALFAVARVHQPSVVFIDEIDSLLSQRSDGEHESSRRIKTEFLVQLDGASTGEADRILVIGATNRPQELDEAARRRFVKRLYIPLPEGAARQHIVTNLMTQQKHQLDAGEMQSIVHQSRGYSGADMANLCREAALGPIRSLPFSHIETMTAEQVRPILHKDFLDAFKQVRASVSDKDLTLYVDWNKQYGSWDIEHVE